MFGFQTFRSFVSVYAIIVDHTVDVCCLICNSASCSLGTSHDTGRTNSVVVIYPARGRERSVLLLTGHVAPPASPSCRIAECARSPPASWTLSPHDINNNKNMIHMRGASRTLQPEGPWSGRLKRLLFQGMFTVLPCRRSLRGGCTLSLDKILFSVGFFFFVLGSSAT